MISVWSLGVLLLGPPPITWMCPLVWQLNMCTATSFNLYRIDRNFQIQLRTSIFVISGSPSSGTPSDQTLITYPVDIWWRGCFEINKSKIGLVHRQLNKIPLKLLMNISEWNHNAIWVISLCSWTNPMPLGNSLW